MNEPELLERYYNEHIDPCQSRLFTELSTEEKEVVKGMWGFAFFKAKVALDEAKQAIKNTLSLN